MIAKLETGLTKAQVQYIMGTPSIKDPFNTNQWDYIGFEIIGDDLLREVHHSLIFEDNKLKTWDRKLESSSNDDDLITIFVLNFLFIFLMISFFEIFHSSVLKTYVLGIKNFKL